MNDEKKLLEYQMITSFIFIGTIVVSILLTYNERQNILKKTPLFNEKEADAILIINRILALILFLVYLYINYNNLKIGELKNENTKYLKLQLIPSFLGVISAIIILYVVISENNINISDIENPTI
ncbi:MAG: hypothetical protein RR404_00295 [Bacilli bacterium]